jgi:oligopeptide/dipeptide ABC transporter ATP-binding protein
LSLLDVRGLTVRYGATAAVDGVSFALEKGESVGLVGESGSGKSQTALALMGLLPGHAVVAGSARFADKELLGRPERELDALRATRIAMVFQDPMQALNPFLTVGAQLRRIIEQHALAAPGGARARVIEMLDRVGLPDAARQYRAYPHELSGGMRQRVMIASALLGGPDLLIADEPTTALDVTVQAQILDLLEELRDETSLLLITHDLGIVAGRCERMLVLEKGRLVEQGPTRQVFAAPVHAHTRALLSAAPRLDDNDVPEPASGAAVLDIHSAKVGYRIGRGRSLAAVRGVGLSVRDGETVAVVGESGSGKSSLVRAALGLVPLQAGRVVLSGQELARDVRNRDTTTRRRLQLVFQDPGASLSPRMSVASIVAEPLRVHEPALSAADRRDRVTAILESTGLGPEYLNRYPHELSGGQAQRVAIARALILEPDVLVCDEAVAALDGTVRKQILGLLRERQRATGLAIVFIAHDLAVVRSISHRVLVMYLGEPVELAATRELFACPRHPYTQALLAAIPVPDPDRPGGRASVAGEVPSVLDPPPGCAFHPRCPRAIERCRAEAPAPRELAGTVVSCHRAEEA